MPDSTHEDFMARIEPLRSDLLGLIDCIEELRQEGPVRDSQARREQSDGVISRHFRTPPALEALHLGELQLAAAGEYFEATCRLWAMTEPVTFSDRVLLRAGTEACARSYWLLDPSIDGHRRSQRAVVERIHSISAALDLMDPDARKRQMAWREDLKRRAQQAGLTGRGKKSKRKGERRPNTERAIAILLDGSSDTGLGRMTYKYLSMFAHSTPSGLMSAAALDQVERVDEFTGLVSLVSDTETVNYLLAGATLAYVNAATACLAYKGLDDERWHKQVRSSVALVRRTVG